MTPPKFLPNYIYQAIDHINHFDFIFEVTSTTSDSDFIGYLVIAGTPIGGHYSSNFHINSHLALCATLICHADDLHLYPELLV